MLDDRSSGPLAGLRVADVTHMLAGPYCTWLLGALGATVIKVERPGHGDHTRSLEPRLDDASLYFLGVNRNKLSLTLDLKSSAGRDVFHLLAARADILVENNRPGVMERLGLDHERLRALNQTHLLPSEYRLQCTSETVRVLERPGTSPVFK